MCRNIRVLHNFQPPTTPEEIQAFDRAVKEITEATERLLVALPPRPVVRTRDGEQAKARLKWGGAGRAHLQGGALNARFPFASFA